MEYLIFFIVTFIIILFIYNIFVIRKESATDRMRNSKDVQLILKMANKRITDINYKRLIKYLSISNAFIMSFTGTLVLLISNNIKNFYLWVLISVLLSMLLLLPITLIIYKLVSNIIKKEGK